MISPWRAFFFQARSSDPESDGRATAAERADINRRVLPDLWPDATYLESVLKILRVPSGRLVAVMSSSSPPMNKYWIPHLDIHKKVITAELQLYLGPQATVRPYTKDVCRLPRLFDFQTCSPRPTIGRRRLPHHDPGSLFVRREPRRPRSTRRRGASRE